MMDHFARAILDFEQGWWNLPGPKDELIQTELGMTAAEYYRCLIVLLDDPDARRYDPLTIGRLRRIRDSARPGESSQHVR